MSDLKIHHIKFHGLPNRAANKVHGCAYYTASSVHWSGFQQRNFLITTQKPNLSVAQPTTALGLPHIFAYNREAGSPATAECTSNIAPHMQPGETNTESGYLLASQRLAWCAARIYDFHFSQNNVCIK